MDYIQKLISEVNMAMQSMSQEERLEFWEAACYGYCLHCGKKLNMQDPFVRLTGCHCWNDE